MRKLAILFATAGLLLAGCGDDDAPEDASADRADDVGDALDDLDDDLPGDIAGLSEECRFLLGGAFLNPLSGLGAGSGEDIDLDATAAQLDAAADEAPEEIRDDMRTVSDGFARIAEVLKDVDLSDPSSFADPEVAASMSSLDDVFDEKYEAASDRVSDYLDEHCGDD